MLLRNALTTISTQIATMPFGIIVGILTARFLGPSDRGVFTLLLMIPATATVFVSLGLDSAGIYFYNKEKVPLPSLLSNSLAYVAVSSALACAALWLSRDIFVDAFAGVTTPALLITLVTIPLRMLNQSLSGILKATHKFNTYNLRILFDSLLTLVAMLAVFFVFDGSLLQCLMVYPVVLGILCTWLAFDVKEHFIGLSYPSWPLMKRMLAFGVKSYAGTLAKHVHFKSDIYLVGLYLTSAEIAYYSIGMHLAERLLMIPTTLSIVLFPRLSALSSDSAARLAGRVCRHVLAASVLCGAVLAIVAQPLILFLYGEEYLPAVQPFYLVLLGVAAVGVTRNLANFFRSTNTHHYLVYILLISAALNLVLNSMLIPQYRMMGAALSTLVTYSLQASLIVLVFRRMTQVPLRDILLVNGTDVKYLLNVRAALRQPRRVADPQPKTARPAENPNEAV